MTQRNKIDKAAIKVGDLNMEITIQDGGSIVVSLEADRPVLDVHHEPASSESKAKIRLTLMTEEELKGLLDTPLADLGFGKRLQGVFQICHYHYVGHVVTKSKATWLKSKNLGEVGVGDLEKTILLLGLRLGMTEAELHGWRRPLS